MKRQVLVFDMDGVLAEVSESYREAIVQTVHHFTGRTVPRELIQDYKNRGGFNNDWLLSQRLCRDLGVDVPYETVVDHFCGIFYGANNDGLIARETWIPREGLLERLARRFTLSLFTGRDRKETSITLNRFAPDIKFSPLVTAGDILNGKPAPDGLVLIRRRCPEAAGFFYVGDTVDDARCAAAANVPFIGIAAPDSPWHGELARVLRDEGAIAVLDDVNQIEGVLSE
jgi:HAD superfamily phosphatase